MASLAWASSFWTAVVQPQFAGMIASAALVIVCSFTCWPATLMVLPGSRAPTDWLGAAVAELIPAEVLPADGRAVDGCWADGRPADLDAAGLTPADPRDPPNFGSALYTVSMTPDIRARIRQPDPCSDVRRHADGV